LDVQFRLLPSGLFTQLKTKHSKLKIISHLFRFPWKVISTAFPQGTLTVCKDCELQFFFRCKVIADSDIRQVEKKSEKTGLIRLASGQ
jgi:hypothetical protein